VFSSDGLKGLLDQVMAQLGQGAGVPDNDGQNCNNSGETGNHNKTKMGDFALTPVSAAVIGGLLTQVLEVQSILVDKDQTVQIVLEGSLKRKTEADKIMDQVGPMSFDDVMRAIVGRFA